MSKQLLKVKVENGILNISIGVKALKTSIESGRLDISCGGEFSIDDLEAFIPDFVHELSSEQEDGSTPIDLMFDQVALETLEQGGNGCDVTE